MTLVEGEELQRLWSLVSELSSQLSANRELCQSLQAQADELKGQALHTGTGYTLRRFNLDVSKEKFESELEKLNSQLVLENQSLSHENRQTALLMREYEAALESIMSKFRSFSHATQQHTLELTSHYETLLANDVHRSESASLHASTSYSTTLAHLGGLVRLALREIEGEGSVDGDEEEENETPKISDPFEAEGYRVGSPSGALIDSKEQQKKKKIRNKTAYNSLTGGYTGLHGDPEAEKAERALEARTEEERLRKENELLRELLRISADVTPEVAREFGIEIQIPPSTSIGWSKTGIAGANKLSLGRPRGSRKSLGEMVSPKVEETKSQDSAIADDDHAEDNDAEAKTEEAAKGDNATEGDSSNIVASNSISPSKLDTQVGISPGTIDHVVEGSGGPPQLSLEAPVLNTHPVSITSTVLADQVRSLDPLKNPFAIPNAANVDRKKADLDEKEGSAEEGKASREDLLDQVEAKIAEAAETAAGSSQVL